MDGEGVRVVRMRMWWWEGVDGEGVRVVRMRMWWWEGWMVRV